jgi:hypothetical protein
MLNNSKLNSQEINKRISIHKTLLEQFYNTINKNIYREICSLEFLDSMTKKNFHYDSSNFFCNDNILPTKKIIISHLENLIFLLKIYPKYELALIKKNYLFPNKSNYLIIRKRKDILISNKTNYKTSFFYINKNILSNNFEKFFTGILSKIPLKHKKRENIINILNNNIKILKDN